MTTVTRMEKGSVLMSICLLLIGAVCSTNLALTVRTAEARAENDGKHDERIEANKRAFEAADAARRAEIAAINARIDREGAARDSALKDVRDAVRSMETTLRSELKEILSLLTAHMKEK